MKTYIPLWTDRYPDPEQHYNLGWIYASTKDQPAYSLLPLRYYGRGTVYADDFYNSYTVNHYYPQMTGWHWLQTRVKPAYYFFAEELYKKAAECIFIEHPNLSEISFASQTREGIYPCVWNVPYDTLLSEINYHIKRIHNDGFCIDEFLKKSESNDELQNDSTIEISGVIDGEQNEISQYFYECNPLDYMERELKTGIRYPLDECYTLYRVFTEDELCLGNQSRIYAENERHYSAEFKAADDNDFEALVTFAQKGFNLNTMGKSGETAFSRFSRHGYSFEQLDKLISLGANPALYGLEYDEIENPLWNACLKSDVLLVEYLLSKGVNPNFNTSTDDIYGEFLIDRIERWASEAESNDERTKDEQILKLLKACI